MVLNAFEIAALRKKQRSTQQTEAQKPAKQKPAKRDGMVIDGAGRWRPFERKNDCFVIEGSLSAQQSNAKRSEMRMARI